MENDKDEIEITPEMIERAAAELQFWTEDESLNQLAAERILRTGLGLPVPHIDTI